MEKELLNLILFEIREMKGDMSELKADMKELKTRQSNLETDISEVKSRLTNVENDMSEVRTRLKNVEDLAEFNKETSESIKNVVTSHYMEFKKYIKANDAQHNLYNAKLLQYKKEN